MSAGWEPSFVAVSTLLGEPLEATLAALGARGSALGAGLRQGLESESREARAGSLAREASKVAIALEAMRLA